MHKCFDCGNDNPVIHQHHWLGRKEAPDKKVPLCQNCHSRHHRGMLLISNKASREFNRWYDSVSFKRYIPWNERLDKLDQFGYLPLFDGWENDLQAKLIAAQYADWPGLPVYLSRVDREDLLP
jgi:hypothetical protein